MATRPRRIPGDVQAAIEEKAADRWGPAQIERWLHEQEEFEKKVPTLRTIQRIVKEVVPRDDSADWTLGDSSSYDAGPVLAALAETIERTSGSVAWFSRDLADWIVRVSREAPGLGPHALYYLATSYLRAKEGRRTPRELDAFVAFAPWRDAKRYERAIAEGWIPKPPVALLAAMREDEREQPGVYPGQIHIEESEGQDG